MTYIYSEKFFDELTADPVEALSEIIRCFRAAAEGVGEPNKLHAMAIEAYCVVFEYNRDLKLGLPVIEDPIGVSSNLEHVVDAINHFDAQLTKLRRSQNAQRLKDRASALIGRSVTYTFTEGDIEQIQSLVNELRNTIFNSDSFTENHKERVLKKLEALQAELHKRMTSLDRFWSLLPERAMMLGQVGEDIKPLVDRIEQLVRIAGRAEAKRAELPSDSELPLLPSADDENDSET